MILHQELEVKGKKSRVGIDENVAFSRHNRCLVASVKIHKPPRLLYIFYNQPRTKMDLNNCNAVESTVKSLSSRYLRGIQ